MQCCILLNKESFYCQITQYICDCNGKRNKYIFWAANCLYVLILFCIGGFAIEMVHNRALDALY